MSRSAPPKLEERLEETYGVYGVQVNTEPYHVCDFHECPIQTENHNNRNKSWYWNNAQAIKIQQYENLFATVGLIWQHI